MSTDCEHVFTTVINRVVDELIKEGSTTVKVVCERCGCPAKVVVQWGSQSNLPPPLKPWTRVEQFPVPEVEQP